MIPLIKNKILASLAVILSLITCTGENLAQINIISFGEKVESFREQNPREFVYLHTDREVYSPGEIINFKAYVRDLYNPGVLSSSQNLHLAIYDLASNLEQERVFKIANGQADGTIQLVNNIMEGEYKLVAWTSKMESGPVENVFRKKIFIRPRMLPEIFIEMNAGNTRYLPGELARVNIKLTNIYGKPVKRKKLDYVASLNGTAFETGNARANKDGMANIDFNIPESDEPGLVILEVAAEQLASTIVSNILVPTSKTPIWVDFVPEGGLLVSGLETKIGFKAYDYLGRPVEIEGEVIDNQGKVFHNIKSNGLGFGSFILKADHSKPLKVRLTKPAGIDIDFSLPPIQENVVQLILKERDESNLYFEVNTDIQDASVSLHAVAEANGDMLYDKRFGLKNKSEIIVPTQDVQRPAVVKVNLLASRGQIVAHRSVFIYDDKPSFLKVQNTDLTGNPVKLTISPANSDGDNSELFLSFSATDKQMAPSWAFNQDIMSWFLLGQEGSFATFPPGFLRNPSENDKLIIDMYMLFHMGSDLDWGKIATGKVSGPDNTINDFRRELESYLLADNFELLISGIRQNQFFSRYYLEENPGFTEYLSDNQSSLENNGYLPGKLSSDDQIQKQLAQGQSIMSVLMSIKPYRIMDGKIVFRGNDSFNYQGGVIIVIDGVPRGTNPSVLNSISPLDVESIKASANISDIQKYSGLNSTGVIEITTKRADIQPGRDSDITVLHPTVMWDPGISVIGNNPLELIIQVKNIDTEVDLTLQGIDNKGRIYIWNRN